MKGEGELRGQLLLWLVGMRGQMRLTRLWGTEHRALNATLSDSCLAYE